MLPNRRVTKEQQQGKKGQQQVDECFSDLGWEPRPLFPDLGEDFIVDIYDEGVSAGLAFYAQVKSSDNLSKFKLKGDVYSYPIEIKDLNHWRDYMPPVVLILWDTETRTGHWLTIDDAIVALDNQSPGWHNKKKAAKGQEPKVNVHVPSANTIEASTSDSLRKKIGSLMLPAIMEGKQLTMSLDFSFPATPKGITQREAVRDFVERGDCVTIDGQFLTGIRMSEWYERKLGKPSINPKGKFVIGPRRSNRIEKIRLSLLSREGRAIQTEILEVKAVRVGEKQITFSNEHLPTPIAFSLIVRSGDHVSISVSINGTKSTAGEALRAYSFFDGSRKGGTLRFEILTRPEDWGSLGRFEMPIDNLSFPDVNVTFREMLRKLNVIEVKTGVAFAITDNGIGKDDWNSIHEVYEILETGKTIDHFHKRTQTLQGPREPDAGSRMIAALLTSWREDKPVTITMEMAYSAVEILGQTVQLGKLNERLEGSLDAECAEVLKQMANDGDSHDTVEFTLLEGFHEQIFPEWLPEQNVFPALPEKRN